LKYIRDRGGEEQLKITLGLLSQDDRSILEGWILNSRWYPLELYQRLDDAIARVFSPDDKTRVFIEMGSNSADMNLTGPHKHFVREGDPHFLLSQSSVIYSAYYAVGHSIYQKTGPNSCILRFYEAEVVTPTDCLTCLGWHRRAIELCGGKDVEVKETACRIQGGDHCEFHCSWR
jgi:uncharacterized protein (TIGR02265 family)